jgi:hypothetical protein
MQRVRIVTGNAPAGVGNSVGAIAQVPDATEYFFYRGR